MQSMNRFRVFILIAASITIAGAMWVLVSRSELRVAELRTIQSSSSGHTFCVTNCSARELLFTLRAIEVRDSRGWRVYTNFVPAIGTTDPFVSWNRQRAAPHAVWNTTVTAPSLNVPWRLRIEVAQQSEGVAKLRAWKKFCGMRGSPARFFSLHQYQSFRSYGTTYELVSDEVD